MFIKFLFSQRQSFFFNSFKLDTARWAKKKLVTSKIIGGTDSFQILASFFASTFLKIFWQCLKEKKLYVQSTLLIAIYCMYCFFYFQSTVNCKSWNTFKSRLMTVCVDSWRENSNWNIYPSVCWTSLRSW